MLQEDIESVDSAWGDIGMSRLQYLAWLRIKAALVESTKPSYNTGSLQFFCCLGSEHKCPLNVNRGYCVAESCQYRVAEKQQASA